ncbi:hypothetical protein BRC68_12345 [Halobacteriales archaeon QH_6_64_20]|jgi:hypothetical protein|nr:MAG: hypothetical protein BRC68_12345 [Halobacteriales archaeon QH_6_64_20]
MAPPQGRTTGGSRNDSSGRFEHLVSEATETHVAVVGRHDLDSPHPDVPNHLLEITRIDLGSDGEQAGSERDRRDRLTVDGSLPDREAQSVLVDQFLAD